MRIDRDLREVDTTKEEIESCIRILADHREGMFYHDGEDHLVTIFVYSNISGKKHDLYAVNTVEEAEEVCERLNASVQELLSFDEEIFQNEGEQGVEYQ